MPVRFRLAGRGLVRRERVRLPRSGSGEPSGPAGPAVKGAAESAPGAQKGPAPIRHGPQELGSGSSAVGFPAKGCPVVPRGERPPPSRDRRSRCALRCGRRRGRSTRLVASRQRLETAAASERSTAIIPRGPCMGKPFGVCSRACPRGGARHAEGPGPVVSSPPEQKAIAQYEADKSTTPYPRHRTGATRGARSLALGDEGTRVSGPRGANGRPARSRSRRADRPITGRGSHAR